MANKSSLDKLIDDLDYIENNFDFIFSQDFDNIVARLMTEIGKSTAYDTGLVRDLIKDILSELNRMDLSNELEYTVYEFWKKRQDRELEGSSYEFNKRQSSNKIDYDIVISDNGFANQQSGIVSKIHPRHDANVIPYNVDFNTDKLETGGNRDIDKAIEDLRNRIIDVIEKGVR